MAISILIKPSSGNCNLRCKYCFYREETQLRKGNCGFMSEETAKQLIVRAFENKCQVNFCFQGGEPMLIGLKFYEFFTREVARLNAGNYTVTYAIQTNATLINEGWCSFFVKNKFLVGVSLDGKKEIHDYYRGEFAKTVKGIALLKKHNIPFNILTVVTSAVAKHYKSQYEFLKKYSDYLQFVALLDPFEGGGRDCTLSAKDYGRFLIETFRLWYADRQKGSYVSIRLFDSIMQKLKGADAELCSMRGRCSLQYVIEFDGKVYPCDFYCLDEWALGDIFCNSFAEIALNSIAQKFLREGEAAHSDCSICKYYKICGGGCKRERVAGKSKYCQSYLMLFEEILG